MENITYPSTTLSASWDPLALLESEKPDEGILFAAQRREIKNILKSYTGYYDLFAEMLQNALDAVEKQTRISQDPNYKAKIWITIDMINSAISVTDNGCGMSNVEFKQFLRPNFSFKDGKNSRGCKGVGTTYLAYGFNHLEIATKHNGQTLSGKIVNGRNWVEDKTETLNRPRVEEFAPSHHPFKENETGTSVVVKLIGDNIRPKNLLWLGASNANQWLAILQANTAIGGVYLCGVDSPNIEIELDVIAPDGISTNNNLPSPKYLYPHEVIKNSADLGDFLKEQAKRVKQNKDVTQIPSKYQNLNGIWMQWTGKQILDKDDNSISPRLDTNQIDLVNELEISVYAFLTYTTEIWDKYNDMSLQLRKGHRLLHGGLQLATRNMVQGTTITIPLTSTTGFQHTAHVIVHMENCEPDLGRKGFQPDQTRLAEQLSVAAVNALKKYYHQMLKKPGATREYGEEKALEDWIRNQEAHEKQAPITIKGSYLFCPTEELPIKSEPIVEQDVVALFNQMLSSGLIRGIQLISSSQYKQYDGLFRLYMDEPFDRYIISETNPLGLSEEMFVSGKTYESKVKVIEYKYSMNGLIEELQTEMKNANDISIIVAWEMGEKWKNLFEVVSLLNPDDVHHRRIHGTTHQFTHSGSGSPAFSAIILKDLISYLGNQEKEIERQRQLYSTDDF